MLQSVLIFAENKLKELNKDERSSDSKRYLTRRYRDEAEKGTKNVFKFVLSTLIKNI